MGRFVKTVATLPPASIDDDEVISIGLKGSR